MEPNTEGHNDTYADAALAWGGDDVTYESHGGGMEITESDWISDHQDQLHNMYTYIMNLNKKTGFMIFDNCNFPEFCVLAYEQSSVYKNKDRYFRNSYRGP